MLFLGVLSVLQLILFPGLLLIRYFSGKRTFVQQAVYVFMLSLLSNYVVIFALTAVSLYRRSVVLALFALELAALIWVYRTQLKGSIGGWSGRAKQGLSGSLRNFSQWLERDSLSASLYFLFGLAAVLALLWLAVFFIDNLDTVWQEFDAYASWDRWAEKWAENRFPGDTWEYPQLLPVSYSLTYKFIGTDAVKFFSKSFMPLFSIMIVLMLFDLGKARKSYGYMLAAALSLHLIYVFLGDYIGDGYVDIPVAALSLMAIYSLFKARNIEDRAELKQALLLGSLSTAAAAVSKQTGLYLMAFYPLLAYWWILRIRDDFDRRAALTILAGHFALTLAIVAPWYAFMEYRILTGSNNSNIQYVINDIYDGQTLPERFMAAVQSLGNYVYLYAFLLVSLPVLKRRFQHIVLLLILPFSILWAFFLSYEHRNLAVALPLIALVSGVSVQAWIERGQAAFSGGHARRWPALAVPVLLVAALGLGTLVLDSGTLVQHQLNEQRQIFRSSLNDAMYRYFNNEIGPELVITSYQIGWLPGLEDTWVLERFGDYDAYQQKLQQFPAVTLLLVPVETRDPSIAQEIQQLMDDGVYQLIFIESDHMLVRIPARE